MVLNCGVDGVVDDGGRNHCIAGIDVEVIVVRKQINHVLVLELSLALDVEEVCYCVSFILSNPSSFLHLEGVIQVFSCEVVGADLIDLVVLPESLHNVC